MMLFWENKKAFPKKINVGIFLSIAYFLFQLVNIIYTCKQLNSLRISSGLEVLGVSRTFLKEFVSFKTARNPLT